MIFKRSALFHDPSQSFLGAIFREFCKMYMESIHNEHSYGHNILLERGVMREAVVKALANETNPYPFDDNLKDPYVNLLVDKAMAQLVRLEFDGLPVQSKL